MKTTYIRTVGTTALSLLCVMLTASAQYRKPDAAIRRIPNFVLPDATGKQVALADYSEAQLLVIAFLGSKCPIGNVYLPTLNGLQKRYPSDKVQVIGIASQPYDSTATISRHIKAFSISFPVLFDREQLAMDLIGAQRTPEVFVLDRRRTVRYRGRIDDRVGFGYKRDKPRRSDLELALDELLASKPVSVPATSTEGCLITRRSVLKGTGKLTYAKHVAPILQERCMNCHHPGTAAPFSLISYADARGWTRMIKETILQRRMPPWGADPRHGKFINDLRMTKTEIETVVAWIDGGAPFGDKRDLPAMRQYAEGWLIGKPDVVLKMPTEFTVKAAGTVQYQYFVTPTNFKEDVWVQSAETRPGNRSVVHHIIPFVRSKGAFGLRNTPNMPSLGGYAPGLEPMELPRDVGFKVPAGADIVWQVHYTPSGKVETDRSELGLVLRKDPPRRPMTGGGIFNVSFRIPPGEGNHRVVSQMKFPNDVELLSLMPHMHLRGKAFRYTAIYPDGKSEILLDVPDYDFNWQHNYRFEKPFALPAGTTIACEAHFDNSTENPANPDATKEVLWGDQTWEEMMIGWYVYIEPQDAKVARRSAPVNGAR